METILENRIVIGQIPSFEDNSLLTNASNQDIYKYVSMFKKQLEQEITLPESSKLSVVEQDNSYYVYYKFNSNVRHKEFANNIEDIIPDYWNIWTYCSVVLNDLMDPYTNTDLLSSTFPDNDELIQIMVYTKKQQVNIFLRPQDLSSDITNMLDEKTPADVIVNFIKSSNIAFVLTTVHNRY